MVFFVYSYDSYFANVSFFPIVVVILAHTDTNGLVTTTLDPMKHNLFREGGTVATTRGNTALSIICKYIYMYIYY